MSNSTQNETHNVCNERLAKEGGQARCCDCEPHEGCTLGDRVPEASKTIDTKNEMRNAGICISCGKPMIVPANQMAGLKHKECEKSTQNDWAKRFDDEFPCLMHFRPNKKSYGYSEVGNDVKAFIAKLLADARKEVINQALQQLPRPERKVWAWASDSVKEAFILAQYEYETKVRAILATLKEERV